MRVLVTGANGFIGRSVVRRLRDAGHDVHAYVRREADAEPFRASSVTPFIGPIGDPNLIAGAARSCDVVVHAAALRHGTREELAWTNVAGTENVMLAARDAGVKRIVMVSCADVSLADEPRVAWNEDRLAMHPCLDEHAESKRLAEDILLATSGEGLETCAVRPALVWGEGDTSTLPALCREGLRGGIRNVADGATLFSCTHVENLGDAIIAMLDAPACKGRAYYITDDEFIEAREFFEALSKACGLPSPRNGLPLGLAIATARVTGLLGGSGLSRSELVKRGRPHRFDIQAAARDFDYKPRITMDHGMSALAAWVRERGGPTAIGALDVKAFRG